MSRACTRVIASAAALALGLGTITTFPASADPRATDKTPTAKGSGGAVSSVDPEATAAGIEILRKGGNAVDAAVATAAALGVTEPYSAGIGGGGYFMYYDSKTGKISTIDGRETAPAAMPHDAFVDPETGEPYNFTPELVTSGVAVGVPGTLATWQRALDNWGSQSLKQVLRPATQVASRGFVVDETFRDRPLITRNASLPSARRANCSCQVAMHPRLAVSSRTLILPRPTACLPSRGPRRSTRARWPRQSPRRCKLHPRLKTPSSRFRPVI